MSIPVGNAQTQRHAPKRTPSTRTALIAAVMLALFAGSTAATARGKSNQIQYEYVPPKNPAHQAIYDRLADTAVVYGWDAEAAKLRAIARERQEALTPPAPPGS